MAAYLTWRRLGPARALYLPVDLLEGGAGGGARRQVIGGSARGMAILLTLACANFEAVLVFGMYASVVLFVPVEFLSESARALWTLAFEAPPRWAQLAGNALVWVASSAIEPFYVGAGFGMYLNRRTQIEGWDIEPRLPSLAHADRGPVHRAAGRRHAVPAHAAGGRGR